MEGGEEAEVFLDGEVGVEGESAGHVADVGAEGGVLGGGVVSGDVCEAGVGGEEGGDDAEEGGFAGTVGTDEAKEFPPFNVERYIV